MDFLLAEAMRAEACAEKCFFCGDHLITTKPVSGTCLGPHEVCLSGIAGLVLAAGPRAGDLEAPGSGPLVRRYCSLDPSAKKGICRKQGSLEVVKTGFKQEPQVNQRENKVPLKGIIFCHGRRRVKRKRLSRPR